MAFRNKHTRDTEFGYESVVPSNLTGNVKSTRSNPESKLAVTEQMLMDASFDSVIEKRR